MPRPVSPLIVPANTEITPEIAFAQFLRTKRQALGLSQSDLTGDQEFDQAYISKLELGQRQVCFRGIIHLAKKLQMRPEELVAEVMKRLGE